MNDFLPPWLRDPDDEPEDTGPLPEPDDLLGGSSDDALVDENAPDLPPWLAVDANRPVTFTKETGELSDEFLAAADDLPDTMVGSVTYDQWKQIQYERTRERSLDEEVPDLLEDLPTTAALSGVMDMRDTGELPDWFLGLEELDEKQAPSWYVDGQDAFTAPQPPSSAALEVFEGQPPDDLDNFFSGLATPAPSAGMTNIPSDVLAALMQPDLNDSQPFTPVDVPIETTPGNAAFDYAYDADEENFAFEYDESLQSAAFDEAPAEDEDTAAILGMAQARLNTDQLIGTFDMPADEDAAPFDATAFETAPRADGYDFDDLPSLGDAVEPPATTTMPNKSLLAKLKRGEGAELPPPAPAVPEPTIDDMSWLNEISAIVGAVVGGDEAEEWPNAGLPPKVTTENLPDTSTLPNQSQPLIEDEPPDWLTDLDIAPEDMHRTGGLPSTPVIDFSGLDMPEDDQAAFTGELGEIEEDYPDLFADIGRPEPAAAPVRPPSATVILEDQPEAPQVIEPPTISPYGTTLNLTSDSEDEFEQELDIPAPLTQVLPAVPPPPSARPAAPVLPAAPGEVAIPSVAQEVRPYAFVGLIIPPPDNPSVNETIPVLGAEDLNRPDVLPFVPTTAELRPEVVSALPFMPTTRELQSKQVLPPQPPAPPTVVPPTPPTIQPPAPPTVVPPRPEAPPPTIQPPTPPTVVPPTPPAVEPPAPPNVPQEDADEDMSWLQSVRFEDDPKGDVRAAIATLARDADVPEDTREMAELFIALQKTDYLISTQGQEVPVVEDPAAAVGPGAQEAEELSALYQDLWSDAPPDDWAPSDDIRQAGSYAPPQVSDEPPFGYEQGEAGDETFAALFGGLTDEHEAVDEDSPVAWTAALRWTGSAASEPPAAPAQEDDDLTSLLSDLSSAPRADFDAARAGDGIAANTGELNALFGEEPPAPATSGTSDTDNAFAALFGFQDDMDEAQSDLQSAESLFADLFDAPPAPGPSGMNDLLSRLNDSKPAEEPTMPKDDFDSLFDDMDDKESNQSGSESAGGTFASDADLDALFAAYESEGRGTGELPEPDDDDLFNFGLDDFSEDPPDRGKPPRGPDTGGFEGFSAPEVSNTTDISGEQTPSLWEDEEDFAGDDLPKVPAFTLDDLSSPAAQPPAEATGSDALAADPFAFDSDWEPLPTAVVPEPVPAATLPDWMQQAIADDTAAPEQQAEPDWLTDDFAPAAASTPLTPVAPISGEQDEPDWLVDDFAPTPEPAAAPAAEQPLSNWVLEDDETPAEALWAELDLTSPPADEVVEDLAAASLVEDEPFDLDWAARLDETGETPAIVPPTAEPLLTAPAASVQEDWAAAFDAPAALDEDLPALDADWQPEPAPSAVTAAPIDPAPQALPDWLSQLDAIDETLRSESPAARERRSAADLDSYLADLDAPEQVLPLEPAAAVPITSTAEIDIDKLFTDELPVVTVEDDVPKPAQTLAPADMLDELGAAVGAVSAGAIARQLADKPESELSDRLQKLRKRSTDELAAAKLEKLPADDIASALPGVANVIAPAPFVVEPQNLAEGIALTPQQQKHVALLRDLVGLKDEPGTRALRPSAIDLTYEAPHLRDEFDELLDTMQANPDAVPEAPPVPKLRRRRTYRIDRLLVSLLLAAGVALPFFVPQVRFGDLPPAAFAAAGPERRAFTQIDRLRSFDLVLVGLDYGPAAASELDPMTDALVRHVLLRGARPVFISSSPFTLLRAQTLMDAINADRAFLRQIGLTLRDPLRANSDYYITRYLPGSALGLRAFGENVSQLLTFDINGQATGLALDSLSNLALIAVVSDRPEDVRAYAEQIAPIANRPLVVGVNYASEPLAEPYAAANVLDGLLVGYGDALTYRAMLGGVREIERDERPVLPQPTPSAPVDATPAPGATPVPGAEGTAEVAPPPSGLTATVISADGVNVRSGPGTDFARVTGLARNATVPVIGLNDDGDWVNVRLPDGTEGWVSAGLVVLNEGAAAPSPTPTPASSGAVGPSVLRQVAAVPTPIDPDSPDALRWYAINAGIVVTAAIITLGSILGILRGLTHRRRRS